MQKNETKFRDFIAELLIKAYFKIEKEYRLPGGKRVDILATKKKLRLGIEVKLIPRGVNDDISKANRLLQMPELDEVYVAAPVHVITNEHDAYAQMTGVGLIEVLEHSFKYRLKSQRRRPAELWGGGGLNGIDFAPGSIVELYYHVKNHGNKIARNAEMFFIPSGPFVKAPNEKAKFKKSIIEPEEDWRNDFKIKVKKNIASGKYPLFIGCTADNIKSAGMKIDITIKKIECT